jgi:hypothetical protein
VDLDALHGLPLERGRQPGGGIRGGEDPLAQHLDGLLGQRAEAHLVLGDDAVGAGVPAVLRGLAQQQAGGGDAGPEQLLGAVTGDVAGAEGLGHPVEPDHRATLPRSRTS